MLWFQKSREQWVRFGDRNTAFFHAQTLTRRKRNKIEGLHIAGDVWCTDGELLKSEALNFFKKLFITESPARGVEVSLPSTSKLGPEAVSNLLKDVSKGEVWEALKFMKAFKAPGPDGFQPIIIKRFW